MVHKMELEVLKNDLVLHESLKDYFQIENVDMRSLKDEIIKNKVLVETVVCEGNKVVLGWYEYLVCLELKIKPKIRYSNRSYYEEFYNNGISKSNLTMSQKVTFLIDEKIKGCKINLESKEDCNLLKREIHSITGASYTTIHDCIKVFRRNIDALILALKQDRISIDYAEELLEINDDYKITTICAYSKVRINELVSQFKKDRKINELNLRKKENNLTISDYKALLNEDFESCDDKGKYAELIVENRLEKEFNVYPNNRSGKHSCDLVCIKKDDEDLFFGEVKAMQSFNGCYSIKKYLWHGYIRLCEKHNLRMNIYFVNYKKQIIEFGIVHNLQIEENKNNDDEYLINENQLLKFDELTDIEVRQLISKTKKIKVIKNKINKMAS